ncbi:MAG: dephospho-CoA kinase [Clostridia bacterium]|nr:dephospho-CoA kinase [Clostridia bacterium]
MMQKNNKKTIWLMGGSGSGKSTAAQTFRALGIEVVDADKVSREIMEKGQKAFNEVLDAFGDKILTNDEINRKKLGEEVFADKNKLRILNEITHKYISEELGRRAENAKGTIVFDAALLPDEFLECDIVLLVTARKETRIERIMRRDGISRKNAENRISSQPDDETYRSRADYVFENNGTPEQLENEIKNWCINEKIN